MEWNGVMATALLVVEGGPDKGMEIAVPAAGVRLGRSSGNDVVLADPSLSRFHCRFFFKDGTELHVSDLASTNETLVNGKPSRDGLLKVGDRITIGETVIKFVQAAGPTAAAEPPPPAQPAPARPEPSGPASHTDIDLGLDRADGFEAARAITPRSSPRGRLLLLGGAIVILIGAALIAKMLMKPAPVRRVAGAGTRELEIHYEKVEAGQSNIFRYAVTLQGEVLSVRVDNLADGQHVGREKKTDPKLLDLLAASLEQSGFFQLGAEYQGLAPGVWDQSDLTVSINRRTHRVRVLNRLLPDEFKKASEEIEEFVRNEMGLYALALPPDKLVALGQNAWLAGQKFFDEREVRHDNLARAIKSLTEAESLVEALEPKPEFYAPAIALREEAKRALQEKFQDYLFRADRAIRLREWREANTHLQILLETISDRSDERYDTINKKLIDVQRRLDRK